MNIFGSEGNVLRFLEKGRRMGQGLRLLRRQSHAVEDGLDGFDLCDEGKDLYLGATESTQQRVNLVNLPNKLPEFMPQ